MESAGASQKTVKQLFEELSKTNAAFKFSVVGGVVRIEVDGLADCLGPRQKRGALAALDADALAR